MIKPKKVYERFEGPWQNEGTIVFSAKSMLNNGEMVKKYNELLSFTTEMAKAFNINAPEQFRKFWYEESK